MAMVISASSVPTLAATWGGGSGNWSDDSWGLAGGAPGDGSYGAETALINTTDDVVTIQAGTSYTTSGELDMGRNAHLIVEGTLDLPGTGTNGGNTGGGGGNVTIRGNGSVSLKEFHFYGLITITNSATLTIRAGEDNGNTDFDQAGGTVYNAYFRNNIYNLRGGNLYTTNSRNAWGEMQINISGGAWMESGTFAFYRGGEASINVSGGSVSIADNLSLGEERSELSNQGTKRVSVSGGSLTVNNDLQFWADSHGGRVSDCLVEVSGSGATLSVGGVTTGGVGVGSAVWEFWFTPDANGLSAIQVTNSVPDFSEFNLNIQNMSATYNGGDMKLFDIVGMDTEAGPFSNFAEGANVRLHDGSKDYHFRLTYSGGDGNDIVLKLMTVGGSFGFR